MTQLNKSGIVGGQIVKICKFDPETSKVEEVQWSVSRQEYDIQSNSIKLSLTAELSKSDVDFDTLDNIFRPTYYIRFTSESLLIAKIKQLFKKVKKWLLK